MIYVFLADGFEEIEALTVVDIARRAGIDTTVVSINDDEAVTGAHNILVKADTVFDKVDWSKCDMIVLPGGGPGTVNLRNHDELMKKVDEFNAAGKEIAAICAAPAKILGDKGLLKGKKAICFPGLEDLMEGATRVECGAITDGNIITGCAMGTAIDFALEIVKSISGEDKAAEMAKQIVYRK